MKILIELPTWLGDAVMTTPAINNLMVHFEENELTFLGSKAALEVMEGYPNVVDTKPLKKDFISQYKVATRLGSFDYFFSFRGSLRSKFLKFLVKSNNKFQFDKRIYQDIHQVEKYNSFVNDSLKIKTTPGKLNIYQQNTFLNKKSNLKLLGINPGASYGYAKRWYPEKFAEVIKALSKNYDTVILGGDKELDIANDIEKLLIESNVFNYENLAGKTSISDLKSVISTFDLFITGDSGPMHIASSFQVPSISIFGPTRTSETSQWLNERSVIVKKNFKCQPCMKRKCPLKHHKCMKEISEIDVLEAVKLVN